LYVDSDILPLLIRPARYLGGEVNSIVKRPEDVRLNFALIFPDLYEVGISHYGFQVLYEILNAQDGIFAERIYHPAPDLEQIMRERGMPPRSLETGRPLADFDIIGFTLPYELCYTGVLNLLELGGIELRHRDRLDKNRPLVLGGGCQAANPEPVAPFFDAFFLGEAESGIVEIATAMIEAKGKPLAERLQSLGKLPGIYVPANFRVEHNSDGTIKSIDAVAGESKSVLRRVISDMQTFPPPSKPLVPYLNAIHDRVAIEISRGCGRTCRFCSAGVNYRPVREREPDEIIKAATSALDATGYDSLSLLSLSAGDYSKLPGLIEHLVAGLEERAVAVSLPSLRIGSLTEREIVTIKRVRKTGFTFAPEAGSERLRRVINKNITDEEIIETCRTVFDAGWRLVKLYFMIGLPTETDDDIAAIIDLCYRVSALKGKKAGKRAVNISVMPFIPKPHTPFEREPMLDSDTIYARIERLKKSLRGFKLSWNRPLVSELEGIFSRGDRRLADLLEQAHAGGARLDAWSDYLKTDLWRGLLDEMGDRTRFYINRRRETDEILPWAHLDVRIAQQYLDDQRDLAETEDVSVGCIKGNCDECGICDPPEIDVKLATTDLGPAPPINLAREEVWDTRLLVSYVKSGRLRFLSHLETMHTILRAVRRAGLPMQFSAGFHPHPKATFGPALPVGTAGLDEFFLISLNGDINAKDAEELLAAQLPDGLNLVAVEAKLPADKAPEDLGSIYEIDIDSLALDKNDIEKAIGEFFAAEVVEFEKIRKGKKLKRNLREFVFSFKIKAPEYFADAAMALELGLYTKTTGSVKPVEVLEAVFKPEREQLLTCPIARMKRLSKGNEA
jgi:radical SAM family uncharacterized protein/radical SAM-linked protein